MTVILDARELGEKKQAHAYLSRIFSFPDYYGNNLDALYDCLAEYQHLTICLLHVEDAGEYFPKIQSVLEDLEDVKVRYL